MIVKGSCNGKVWAVNDGAYGMVYAGPSLIEDANYEHVYLEQKNKGHLYALNNRGKYGVTWCWRCEAFRIQPLIWTINNSAGQPQIVWESETVIDLNDPTEVPVEVQFRGRDIVDSYNSIQMAWLNETKVSAIEDDVEAAVIPEWVSGLARLGDASSTSQLLNILFVDKQVKRDMRVFGVIDDVFKRNMVSHETNHYLLLWLRSASQILENHAGETCVPLICNRLTIDSTTGQATVV